MLGPNVRRLPGQGLLSDLLLYAAGPSALAPKDYGWQMEVRLALMGLTHAARPDNIHLNISALSLFNTG